MQEPTHGRYVVHKEGNIVVNHYADGLKEAEYESIATQACSQVANQGSLLQA